MTKIAFLGPVGTHTEEALLSLELTDATPVPFPSIEDVFTAVERGKTALGIVPIENSIEGSVNATLDGLSAGGDLTIQREVVRDIHHALVAAPGVGRHEITGIVSHPQASAQCRKWLSMELPGKSVVAANSTAEAVQRAVAEPGLGAIGTRLAAELHGAEVIEDAIEDYGGNQTRFVVIGRGIQPKSGHDKTSLALYIHESKPGALLMILSEFAYGQINLTKIQSRPTKRQLGDYMFFVDCEGHVSDPHVSLALDCLRLKLREVRVLGSYPNAR